MFMRKWVLGGIMARMKGIGEIFWSVTIVGFVEKHRWFSSIGEFNNSGFG